MPFCEFDLAMGNFAETAYPCVFVNGKTGHFNFEKPSTFINQRLKNNNEKPPTLGRPLE
jgi:hypothetical protein